MARNIIDMPIGEKDKLQDQLDLDKYVSGLSEFIKTCEMPTTIAIQGEWGSGKTSMMNLLRARLCRELKKDTEDSQNDTNPYYGIWINVWKYSLMKTPEMTLLSVISAMTEEIVRHMQLRHEDSMHRIINNVGNILGRFLKTTTSVGINIASNSLGFGSITSTTRSEDEAGTSVLSPDVIQKTLRNAISDFILAESESAARNNTTPIRGFLFFIDDLDRLDPQIAVSLLELLKNIFEVINCIFVLAIDYDVVVRGLRAKYGDQKISAENERQYRSFFDKIIQLPFNMPQNNYNIENFLSVGLKNIGYFDKNQLQDKSKKRENDVLPILKDLVRYSTGNNPRSIIRIINSLSLINIMQNQIKNELTISDEEKILNFGLICMQIAYPKIYRLLQQYPDFAKDWKDKYEEIIRKFDLQNVDDEEGDSESGNSSNSSIAYDEDETSEAEGLEGRTWDRLIDAISLGDVYLKRHRADISDMLAIFETLFSEDIGSHVKSILNISAVTSVSNPKSGEDDHVSQTLSENNNADPIERFCKLIKDHFTDPDDQGKIDRKIDDSIKLYKKFFDGLKERYGNLIKFVCRKGIVVKVSNPSTHTRNIGWTYGFDYIRRGKFSFKILDSNFKSYSSLDEVDSSFYDEFTEVINKYSSDKVPENNKLRQH